MPTLSYLIRILILRLSRVIILCSPAELLVKRLSLSEQKDLRKFGEW